MNLNTPQHRKNAIYHVLQEGDIVIYHDCCKTYHRGTFCRFSKASQPIVIPIDDKLDKSYNNIKQIKVWEVLRAYRPITDDEYVLVYLRKFYESGCTTEELIKHEQKMWRINALQAEHGVYS